MRDLGPEVCTPTKAAVWLAFWAESRGRPKYRQLCRKLAEGYFRQVRDLCARLAADRGYGEIDVENISWRFNSLINGLWVDMAIDPQSFDRERARHACRAYLAGFFPAEFGPQLAAENMNRRRAGRITAN